MTAGRIWVVVILLCLSACAPRADTALPAPAQTPAENAGLPAAGASGASSAAPKSVKPEIDENTASESAGDVPEPEPEPEPVSVKLQLAGDILLHSGPIRHALTDGGAYDFRPYFELIAPYLDGDLSICNMEAPVDAFGDNKNLSTYPRFNSPYEILEALKWAGFDHLLTANNHAFDKGEAGLEATVANIARAGLGHTGTYLTPEARQTPSVIEVKGVNIGVAAYTDSCNGLESLIPAQRRAYAMNTFNSARLDDLPAMAADIGALRGAGADIVIFALHWGAEYTDKPATAQRDIALALCEAGADIVMGGHSHSVQPIEWADVTRADGSEARCLIIYSLGNFFADQIGMNTPRPKTQYGMLADVTVTKSPGGQTAVEDCSVLATLSYRGRASGGERYRLMPLDGFAPGLDEPADAPRPAFIPDDAALQWANRAYAHVVRIVGADFVR